MQQKTQLSIISNKQRIQTKKKKMVNLSRSTKTKSNDTQKTTGDETNKHSEEDPIINNFIIDERIEQDVM